MQKRITDLLKEIWAQVVTTSCPHCGKKSPAVKRDGFTKLFVKPLAAKSALVSRQARALQTKERSRSRDSSRSQLISDAAETHTNASTAGGANTQRKSSHATEPDELSELSDTVVRDVDEDADSESSEEEYKEGGA